MKLYKQLADDLSVLIRQGALKPGDRVPSVRATSRERGMSPATVIHAYELLGGQGDPCERAGDKGSRRHRAIIDAAQEERLRSSCSG
jgi:DNA-binding transcriptional regulator YhcF (GntR family)